MPGGRNSGAVYNLYKVKYKKHKKPASKQPCKSDKLLTTQQQQQQQLQQHQQLQLKSEQQQQQQQQQPPSSISSNLVNGTILKTALTNPSEVVRLRQRLDSAVSSSRDRNFSIEYSMSMIKTLIDCDEFQDIATLQNLDDLLDHNTDLSAKLRHIGDSIVYKLVQWTKRLPFYLELPVEVHTRLLTHKWHELLVLTTSAYQAIHKPAEQTVVFKTDFTHEVRTKITESPSWVSHKKPIAKQISVISRRLPTDCEKDQINAKKNHQMLRFFGRNPIGFCPRFRNVLANQISDPSLTSN